MMSHIITEVNSKICDISCVTFKSCEGKSIQVNKYFLFLYNAFYRSILDECTDEGIVFIFEGATLDDLTLLKEQIYQKHLQCSDHSQLSEDYQKKESTEEIKDLISREYVEDGKLEDNKNDVHSRLSEDHQKSEKNEGLSTSSIESDEDGKLQNVQDAPIVESIEFKESEENGKLQDKDKYKYKSSVESLTLKCPFKCDEGPDNNWTVDTLFAHIFSRHRSEVKNNFFVSINTFIDKLSSELSSKNCAFKCEKSRNSYADLRALRIHYYRCHADDPVICSKCGESFLNSLTYSSHKMLCHLDKKTCDLCNNGKIYKNIRVHMKERHGGRKFECKVEGCKIKFKTPADLRRHTIVVHKKEKPFVCDKCGIRMAQMANLKDHRMKVHGEKYLTFKEYKEIIRSGKHNFVPKESDIPRYM